jgi:hypothetical protein
VSIISFIVLLFINSLLNGLRGIQAELELRNASSDDAQKLQTIIKNIPFDMWLCDREQRYILQSVESYKIRGDMIGRKIEELGQSAEMVLQGKVAESGGTIYKEGTWQVNGEMRDFITMLLQLKAGMDY